MRPLQYADMFAGREVKGELASAVHGNMFSFSAAGAMPRSARSAEVQKARGATIFLRAAAAKRHHSDF